MVLPVGDQVFQARIIPASAFTPAKLLCPKLRFGSDIGTDSPIIPTTLEALELLKGVLCIVHRVACHMHRRLSLLISRAYTTTVTGLLLLWVVHVYRAGSIASPLRKPSVPSILWKVLQMTREEHVAIRCLRLESFHVGPVQLEPRWSVRRPSARLERSPLDCLCTLDSVRKHRVSCQY